MRLYKKRMTDMTIMGSTKDNASTGTLITMEQLFEDLTQELHDLVKEHAISVSKTEPYAYGAGYYQSLVDWLPDTPENRKHIQGHIDRLKETKK